MKTTSSRFARAATGTRPPASLAPGAGERRTPITTSPPRSAATPVGIGSRTTPSTSARPSCSTGGKIPGSEADASTACHSGPWCSATGSRVTRSTATAAKGSGRSSISREPTTRRMPRRMLRLLKSEA